MAIVWNKVTWYSKLLAVALFMGIFAWGFYLGASYGVAVGELTGRTAAAGTIVGTAQPKLCSMVAQQSTTAYMRPSLQAGVFGTVPVAEVEVLGGRTAEGWLGFDPGVAQAPNVGPFRLRWVLPGAPVTLTGGCTTLPVLPALPPNTCFTMAQTDALIYQAPQLSSTVVAHMRFGDYLEVVGRQGNGSATWIKVQSPVGTLPTGTSGWLPENDINFNGACDQLSAVKG